MAGKSVTFRKQLITDTFVVPHTNRKPFPKRKRISRRRRAKMEAAAEAAAEAFAQQAWQVLLHQENQDMIMNLARNDLTISFCIYRVLYLGDVAGVHESFRIDDFDTHLMSNFYGAYAADRDPPMPDGAREFLVHLRNFQSFAHAFFPQPESRNVSDSSSSVSSVNSSDLLTSPPAESNGSDGDNDNDNDNDNDAETSNENNEAKEEGNAEDSQDDRNASSEQPSESSGAETDTDTSHQRPTKKAKTDDDAKREASGIGD